jgi:colanic acid biosynthesis glycosyl transferase WcaI
MAKLPPSVVFINRVYPPGRGATGRVLRDLAQSFARDGWIVTILTTGPQDKEEKDGSIRVIRVKSRVKGKSLFGYAGAWMRLVLRGWKMTQPDLIVTMTDPPMLLLAGHILAKTKKSRHIHWCQDLYPDVFPMVGLALPDFMMNGLKKLSHRILRRCDRVVAIGRCMAKHLAQSGIDPKKIAVIPNWPEAELLNIPAQSTQARHQARAQETSNKIARSAAAVARPFEELFHDGDMPKFRVLYAGTLGRAHPTGTILDAAEILAKDHPEIEFVCVGDGPGHEKLALQRTKRGLENIRFLPWQPNSRLRDVMESGDVHLISLHQDAAGLMVPSKLYAALAVSRPCIFLGPQHSETARVIADFKAGVVIPQGEADVLARTILTYCENGEVWFSAHAGAGQAGRIFIPDEAIAAWIKRARETVGISANESAASTRAA